MNKLTEEGKCKHCAKDAQAECMECWFCKDKYHVVNCVQDTKLVHMVQPSFLTHQWPSIMRNKKACITFTCPSCREDTKAKEDVLMSALVRLLEETTLKNSTQLEDIKNLLSAILTKSQDESERGQTR